MFFLLSNILPGLFYFILHVTTPGSFPKALNAKAEREYLLKWRDGCIESKNKLIEHNLRLVAHVIKKYGVCAKDHDDLISVGTIGLIKAINTFDCMKGTRLATYAAKCIENEILMQFRSAKKSAMDVFISDPIDIDSEGNALTLSEIIADESNILDDIDLLLKADKLKQFVNSSLDEREREVIIMRYGLFGLAELTQKQVAKRLNISRSYVSRIEKKAVEKLRKKFEEPIVGKRKI